MRTQGILISAPSAPVTLRPTDLVHETYLRRLKQAKVRSGAKR